MRNERIVIYYDIFLLALLDLKTECEMKTFLRTMTVFFGMNVVIYVTTCLARSRKKLYYV